MTCSSDGDPRRIANKHGGGLRRLLADEIHDPQELQALLAWASANVPACEDPNDPGERQQQYPEVARVILQQYRRAQAPALSEPGERPQDLIDTPAEESSHDVQVLELPQAPQTEQPTQTQESSQEAEVLELLQAPQTEQSTQTHEPSQEAEVLELPHAPQTAHPVRAQESMQDAQVIELTHAPQTAHPAQQDEPSQDAEAEVEVLDPPQAPQPELPKQTEESSPQIEAEAPELPEQTDEPSAELADAEPAHFEAPPPSTEPQEPQPSEAGVDDTLGALLHGMSTLAQSTQDAFTLRALANQRVVAIAQAMNLSRKHVERHLVDALSHLATQRIPLDGGLRRPHDPDQHHSAPASLDREAAAWFVRTRADNATEQTREKFNTWINQSELRRDAFSRVDNIWQQVRTLPASDALVKLHQNTLDRIAEEQSQQKRRRRTFLVAGLAVAAIASGLLLGFGADIKRALNAGEALSEHPDFQTPIAGRLEVDLQNGAMMTLNTNTAVQTRNDATSREVLLMRGQVLFDVPVNLRRPVTVTANGYDIIARSALFDVLALEDILKVTVARGGVQIIPSQRSSSEAVINLLPGKQFIVEADGPEQGMVQTGDVAHTISWRQGQLLFDEAPLVEVLAEVNRYLQRPVVLLDSEVASLAFSGDVPAGDREAFLHAVMTSLRLTSSSNTNGEIVLQKPGHAYAETEPAD